MRKPILICLVTSYIVMWPPVDFSPKLSSPMSRSILISFLLAMPVAAVAQITNQSISPALARGLMLICKWDHNDTHRQVRLYGHGDFENGEVKIVERHSEDMIYQTKLLRRESEESRLQISVSLERYSGRIDWSESTGNSYTGYCRPALEPLF